MSDIVGKSSDGNEKIENSKETKNGLNHVSNHKIEWNVDDDCEIKYMDESPDKVSACFSKFSKMLKNIFNILILCHSLLDKHEFEITD